MRPPKSKLAPVKPLSVQRNEVMAQHVAHQAAALGRLLDQMEELWPGARAFLKGEA